MPSFSLPTLARLAFLLVAIFLAFYFRLGSIPLFDVDEGAFAEATREMIVSGDYLHPKLNGAPRYDKPILIYWLQAASVHMFGLNEWAVRLPSAFFATIWVFATFFMARFWFGRNVAFWAAFLQVTSLIVVGIGRAATADAVLNAFLAMAMFFFFVYTQKRRSSFLYLTFSMIGAGFLTKGPIAVLIPLTVSFLYLAVIQKEWRFWLKSICHPWGLLIFAVIGLPWYIYMIHSDGMDFVQGFFIHHNVARFTGPLQGHGGSLLYYIPIVLFGVLPHTALALGVLRKSFFFASDDFGRYVLLWFFFVFFFFSLSGTKLPHYMLYGMSGYWILMAKALEEGPRKMVLLLFPLLFILLLAVLPLGIEVALPRISHTTTRLLLQDALEMTPHDYMMAMIASGLVLLLSAFFFKEAIVFVSGMVLLMIANVCVMPWVSSFLQAPVKEAALLAKHQDAPVVAYKINQPSFSFYAEKIIEKREPHPLELALAKRGAVFPFKVEVLYEKGPIVLVRRLPEQ